MSTKRVIDLNCDLGEIAGDEARKLDEEMIKLISSANIACGFHAGDLRTMHHTVELAAKYGVGIGAHPGLDDREGFGRRPMAITASELRDLFTYQIAALAAFAKAVGQPLQHVKMHGALVQMAREDESLARAMCEATQQFDDNLIWLAPAGCATEIARSCGLKVFEEFYADRAYHHNGSLVSRTQPGAIIEDLEEIEDRLAQVFEIGTVTTIEGKQIPLAFDSICVHGDTRHALDIVRIVREGCAKSGIEIQSLAKLAK